MKRFLLLVVVVAAFAGAFVSRASALAFDDAVCSPIDDPKNGEVHVCPQGTTGASYSVQLKGREGSGCWPYVKFSTTGPLPPGLSLTSSGLISGTPQTDGTWDFYVDMADIPASEGGIFWCADSRVASRIFRISIAPGRPLSIDRPSPKPTLVNQPFSLQLTASGGASLTWSLASGALPPGMTLASGGLLAGTPTAAGSFTFVVKVADGSRSATDTITLKVVEPLTAQAPATVPASEVGRRFALTSTATGGTEPYLWTVTEGTLPEGLTLDPVSGAIAGKPTTAGATSITLTITDTDGFTATLPLAIDVKARLAIATTRLPGAKVGRRYSARIVAGNGVAPRTWLLVRGPLPPGIHFDTTRGLLIGTPRKGGRFTITIRVRDSLGVISTTSFALTVRRAIGQKRR